MALSPKGSTNPNTNKKKDFICLEEKFDREGERKLVV